MAKLSEELNEKNIKNLEEKIYKNFDIKDIRGHLEHIDERCVGYFSLEDVRKKIKKPIPPDFGNFAGDDFSFNNKKYPSGKKNLEELKNIYIDLIKILDDRARKDPKFVEKTEMEKRNKLIMKALKKAGLNQN